jgi:uncharacterized protein YbaR (Trm112 family)
MTVQLDPAILDILACPQCHSNVSIDYETNEVVCIGLACALAYPIRDDIPVMLVEEARPTRGVPPAPVLSPTILSAATVSTVFAAATTPAGPDPVATPACLGLADTPAVVDLAEPASPASPVPSPPQEPPADESGLV